jgi:hypothetical protein
MKIKSAKIPHTYITNVATAILASLLFSCEDKQDYASASYESKASTKLHLSEEFITDKFIKNGISIIEAKALNIPNTELVVNGFIGGLRKPFATHRATFVLADESLERCDEIDDDHCNTPWDVCCEDRNKVMLGTLTVQFTDTNGSVLRGNIQNIHRLRPGIGIQIHGKVAKESLPNAMVINASKFMIKN